MLAGAAAGAVGGAGFSGMGNGWDGNAMLKGAAIGAASGLVGGGVGSAIGGGWGALAGGAASNLTNQLIYNDGDFSKVNWYSVGSSGALSFGMYHGMQYSAWKWGGGNKIGDINISYKQFSKINTMFQRSSSIFWGRKENGLVLNIGGEDSNSGYFVDRKDCYLDRVDFKNFNRNNQILVHSHLRNGMTYASNSHSSGDNLSLKGYNSLVVGTKGSSSWMTYQDWPHVLIQDNPYIRFFLFPWINN
jgi:hypothetical protein